jgi:hypothetical protein
MNYERSGFLVYLVPLIFFPRLQLLLKQLVEHFHNNLMKLGGSLGNVPRKISFVQLNVKKFHLQLLHLESSPSS